MDFLSSQENRLQFFEILLHEKVRLLHFICEKHRTSRGKNRTQERAHTPKKVYHKRK